MKKPQNRKPTKKEHSNGSVFKEEQTQYVWLHVLPDDLWLNIQRGETIWEALQNTNVELKSDCGGLGKCGKCKVKVLSTIGPPTQAEKQLLDEEELSQGIRLACRTKVNHDLVISTMEPEAGAEYFQILSTSHILEVGYRPPLRLEPLVHKQLITMPPNLQNESLSDLDRIKMLLGPEYKDLKAPLHCLRTLPGMLKRTNFQGTAVLHNNCLMAWQNPVEVHRQCGLVFDLGTSTLVGKLINLVDGGEVAVASCLNSQIKRGTNVISRLQYIKEHPRGLQRLHNLLTQDLNQLTARLVKTGRLKSRDIFVAVAAGNTTMQHIMLTLDPSGIAEAPFSPVLTDGVIVKAVDVGLELHPEALFYIMPMKSGYIGGDLISVILASGAWEQEEETILGLDLGTNGEIFLGNRKRLMTCSAAAGPALEGARISQGMIASAGAIEGVSFEEGNLHYNVVGNIKPRGICGSGLVELVAALLDCGIIDEEGLIRPTDKKVAEGLNSRIVNRSGVNDFLIASAEESNDHKPIYLAQRDVRELQLAKAAIAAGVKTLMDEMGIQVEDIHRVYLAGALGNYVNPYSATRIGIIPDVDAEIITSLGNAASTGASMVLLSKDYWQRANELVNFIEHIELSSRLDFNEYFIDQMDFPKGKGVEIRREEMGDMMKTIRVGEIMTRDFPTVSPTTSLEELSERLRDTGHHGFPVLDEEGRLFGCATLADLESAVRSEKTDLKAGDIATKELFVAYPDQTLYEVLRATDKDYGRIPVVDPQDRGRLLGVLRRHDIIRAYRSRVAQSEKETNER
jgi:uncharacterized 2Fe-2S/4Fe-4S cluster protein (DUF4445 family)/CBS domain-containing protein